MIYYHKGGTYLLCKQEDSAKINKSAISFLETEFSILKAKLGHKNKRETRYCMCVYITVRAETSLSKL